jgi:hypothetical protein
MSVVHIYQFCRAFDNVRYSEVYGCYVSGGYAFEKIARASHEVPPEIREAVINDYFKLNDNYPPETGDFALIAREIDDKYSVLAVANRQLDDGGRPTIGYKYFWLEKSSPDVDGIGTLIYWWLNQNQPKFDMAELDKQLSQSPQIFRVHEQYKKLIFEEDQLQNIKRIVVEENKIPYTVVVTKELWRKRYPEYTKLHYLALCFSDRATRLNAWAWNVHKIAYPERFLAIFYATQEDIPKNISKQPLPSPQKDNSNTSVSTPTKENTTQTVPVQKIDNEIYRKIQNIELSSQDKSNSNNEHKNSEAIDNKSENNRSQKKQKLPGKTTTPKRPKRRREINNRIWFILFGIFLVIVVVFVTAIIILIISRNPPPNNNNQDQSHIQNIRKNEKENNSPVNNLENPSANSTTLSTSNTSSGCATDLLSNLEVFKACNETDKDKLKVELRNELHGRYNLFSTEIGEELRQYYLDSKNNDQFQKRKLEIEKCQKDHPITDTSNNDKRGDCIKGTIDKSKQPKKR